MTIYMTYDNTYMTYDNTYMIIHIIYIYMTYGDTSNWGYPKMTFFYVVWDCLHHDLMVIGRRIRWQILLSQVQASLRNAGEKVARMGRNGPWENWTGHDGHDWYLFFSFWHVMVHYFEWHFGFWCPPGFLLVESPSSVQMHWSLEKVPNQPTKFDYASQNMWLKPDKTRMQAAQLVIQRLQVWGQEFQGTPFWQEIPCAMWDMFYLFLIFHVGIG